ncbi:MAG: undecaprenyl-diphosphate phosphatase [Deltaproteobacteria bacterium]|nr:undecaprenyl-diphosphate phosphatase [Deltaproteobacteria bacterium]MBN2670742.1 undecaprenyl-diphosphate phosphatase [Deltaproteobacteria bacterium]
MESLYIALLGAIQGATEFLPVSSSGHLAAGQLLFTIESLKNQPLLLEILLHLATLVAVIAVYRKEVWSLFVGVKNMAMAVPEGRFLDTVRSDEPANLLALLFVATIPTGVIGVVFDKTELAKTVSVTPLFLGVSFLCCAAILVASKFGKEKEISLSFKTALVIGIAQGFAVMPGISRSGTTIAVALLLGMNREQAARFSFLLSIPAILGAAILELDVDQLAASDALGSIAGGVAAAFLCGLGALVLLIRLVKAGRLWLFAPYVATVGVATILFL